jgi:P2 family phage contractile tail tube protein
MKDKIPYRLRNFNVWITKSPANTDAADFLGKALSVTLPKLTEKTEEYHPSGFMAPVDVSVGYEKLTMEMTLAEYSELLFKSFGFSLKSTVDLTLKGGLADGKNNVKPCIIEVKGVITSLDMGDWSADRKSELKVMMTLEYYKLKIGTENLIEIDVIGGINKIGDTDYMNEITNIVTKISP